jgi:alpha-tubulin suppressor-like RCC1 family protein
VATMMSVLGLLTGPARATGAASVAAGSFHTCAVTTDGALRCWGGNGSGQLGDGTFKNRRKPVAVRGLASGVVQVTAGEQHSCALLVEGIVDCWGGNWAGQLGDGTRERRRVPVTVTGLTSIQEVVAGGYHTCALTVAKAVLCWGLNTAGQLGDGSRKGHRVPVAVEGLDSGVKQIAAGDYHTCALLETGGVRCWGGNWRGQLGDGTRENKRTPTDVTGLPSSVKQLSADGDHTCVVTVQDGVFCWGSNRFGQTGQGATTKAVKRPHHVARLGSGVRSVATGWLHTCAITTSKHVKCWGANGAGQGGNGTWRRILTKPVSTLGLKNGVLQLSSGGNHTCAVTISNGLRCWGWNGAGQVGHPGHSFWKAPVVVRGFG